MDDQTLGPLVDTALRTARDGAHVAHAVRDYLNGAPPVAEGVRLQVDSPLRWISPGILRAHDRAPARNRLLLWADTLVRIPRIRVRQDGKTILTKTLPWPASPGRVFRVPADVLNRVDPTGGPVTISLV